MCGVIIVDVGKSRSTNLGRDAYVGHCLGYRHNYWSSINFPIVICLPTVCYFLRQATSEIYDPGSILYHICFPFYFLPLLFSYLLFKNPKIPCFNFICIFYFMFCQDIFIQSITTLSSQLDNFWPRYPKKGLITPYMRRVASICSLCAGTVYIVLLGSPTGLIPWFHN